MSTISEQIAEIDALIAQKSAEIVKFRESAAAWRASKSECAGTAKKKNACAAEKEQMALNREAAILLFQNEITNLIDSKNSLLETQKASNTTSIKLADQGISNAALVIQAEGQAKALQTAAQIKSTAEANAIEQTAASSNLQRNVMIGVVAFVVVVGSVILIKKFAGKSKSKKK